MLQFGFQALRLLLSKDGRETLTALVGDRAARDRQDTDAKSAGLNQLSAEFARERRGILDDMADFLNRLPRPLFALGTFALFVYAFRDPLGFSAMMQALALVPEALWMVLGAVITFYFVGRMQHYQGQKHVSVETVRQTAANIRAIDDMRPKLPRPVKSDGTYNAAISDWQEER